MSDREVRLENLTRREFRQALERGEFQAAIIPTGSIEQHLEHLAMGHDIRSSTYVAQEAAQRLFPQVIMTVPMTVGISEHHMPYKGTISIKPGSWLALLFDAVESLVRHGIKNVLILNGHGGNEAPVAGILRQWQLYFQAADPEVSVQFHSYWNLSREISEPHCKGRIPGHAQEYETAFALAVFPEIVRPDAMQDQEDKHPLEGTVEQGRLLAEAAISKTAEYVQEMLEGKHREIQPHIFSSQLDMRKDP